MSLGRFPDLAHTLPAFPPCEVTIIGRYIMRHYSSWHCSGFTPDSLSQTVKCLFT